MKPALIGFDFETGGLDPRTASPTQLAMIVCTMQLEEIDHCVHKILPTMPVHPAAAAINGYNEEQWAREAIALETADEIFSKWILQFFPEGTPRPIAICHADPSPPNPEALKFDFRFLKVYMPKTYAQISTEQWCSCYAFKKWRDSQPNGWAPVQDPVKGKPVKPNCKLATLAKLAGFPEDHMHDAFWDVRAVLAGLRFLTSNVKYGEKPAAKQHEDPEHQPG